MKPETLVKKMYPSRESWMHCSGRLLIVGGSERYSGSPALAALAAIRSGCDHVTIAAPERAANIAATFSPDLITVPLRGKTLRPSNVHVAIRLAEGFDAALIGGGLGRAGSTLNAVRSFLSRTKLPVVVDADGLHAIRGKRKRMMLTPHAGEFEALTGKKLNNRLGERSRLVIEHARKLWATILLKGNTDVVSDGRNHYHNRTGNPFLSKDGTGDTLAGICGSLLARGNETYKAACAGAYINGLAGDLASADLGEGMMARDLIEYIPRVIRWA